MSKNGAVEFCRMGCEELQRNNTILNSAEYAQKKIRLKSYPQAVFIQMDALCNHDCLFCSRPDNYSYFDLDEFRRDFESLLMPAFLRVSRINLTGSGELLFLPEAKRNLEYFNRFNHAEKMFATNGSSLTPKMTDFIVKSGNKYLIHVSLHAASESVHEAIVKAKTYQVILENLKYLQKARGSSRALKLNLIFVATKMNISELPEFVKFARSLGADGVVAYYNYVYKSGQKTISCYFDQKRTNEMLHKAQEAADECGIDISLPPGFGSHYSSNDELCSEAWNQIMINSRGDVISCDVAGDSHENLKGKKSFMDVWNGPYYTGLRKKLIEKKFDCASFCWRANPGKVNELRSHLITRGKTEKEITELFSV